MLILVTLAFPWRFDNSPLSVGDRLLRKRLDEWMKLIESDPFATKLITFVKPLIFPEHINP